MSISSLRSFLELYGCTKITQTGNVSFFRTRKMYIQFYYIKVGAIKWVHISRTCYSDEHLDYDMQNVVSLDTSENI